MKLINLIVILSLCSAAQCFADTLSADQLLDGVVERLPQDPLAIKGDLIIRRRHGVVEKMFKFEMLLKWGDHPSSASYTIFDDDGRHVEGLSVVRGNSGRPEYKYFSGNSSDVMPLPDLFASVQGSDMSWMDMTLSFLWWRGGKITGEEEIRGRKCRVVEIAAPPHASGGYARVKLWIDAELCMLLQAEGYDAGDKAVRRLWVRSFKKIDDRWMVKDMEISSYPEVHRTKLQIHKVESVNMGGVGSDLQ